MVCGLMVDDNDNLRQAASKKSRLGEIEIGPCLPRFAGFGKNDDMCGG